MKQHDTINKKFITNGSESFTKLPRLQKQVTENKQTNEKYFQMRNDHLKNLQERYNNRANEALSLTNVLQDYMNQSDFNIMSAVGAAIEDFIKSTPEYFEGMVTEEKSKAKKEALDVLLLGTPQSDAGSAQCNTVGVASGLLKSEAFLRDMSPSEKVDNLKYLVNQSAKKNESSGTWAATWATGIIKQKGFTSDFSVDHASDLIEDMNNWPNNHEVNRDKLKEARKTIFQTSGLLRKMFADDEPTKAKEQYLATSTKGSELLVDANLETAAEVRNCISALRRAKFIS